MNKKLLNYFVFTLSIVTPAFAQAQISTPDILATESLAASELKLNSATELERLVLPSLVSETQANAWLVDDPALAYAWHDWQAAQAAAGLVALSPYEWAASYTHQQRDYSSADLTEPRTSNEWNLELERGLRLPGKIGADKRIASASLSAAQAHFNLAQRRAVENLIASYSDSLLAQAHLHLLTQQYEFARNNLDAVMKRVKSGDAAALEARLAEAEAANVAARLSLADTQAMSAWSYLLQRYPAIKVDRASPLPEPIAIHQPFVWWQAQIEAASDELKLAQAEQQAAGAAADRASLDRLPDPTIGVFTARENYSNEQIVGVRIRMALPSKRRSLTLRQKLNQSLLAKDTFELTRRQLKFSTQRAFSQAKGDFRRWQLAEQNASAQRDNARLLQKAYSLGEQDLQSLLLGQQQSLRAAEDEQSARAAALKSYYQILLDAKLLWRDSLFNYSMYTSNTGDFKK